MLETCGTSYIYPQEVQRPNGAQGWAGNPVLNHLNHHSLFGLGLGTCLYINKYVSKHICINFPCSKLFQTYLNRSKLNVFTHVCVKPARCLPSMA